MFDAQTQIGLENMEEAIRRMELDKRFCRITYIRVDRRDARFTYWIDNWRRITTILCCQFRDSLNKSLKRIREMNIKFISIAALFIILILILSEINNSKTKQQLQNDRYEAEERLKGSKENF